MKEYLFLIVALCGALDLLLLVGNDKYKKITDSALGVLMILVIALPLPKVFDELKNDFELENFDSAGDADEFGKSSFEMGIKEYIAGEFSLSRDDVSVEAIGFSSSEMKAEKIIITLTGGGILSDNKKIERAVKSLELGAVEVKFEI